MEKNEIRKIFKQKRLELTKRGVIDAVSNRITDNIINSDSYKNSTRVALYYPLEGEIDLRKLLDGDKSYYLPKCINNELYFAKYTGTYIKGDFNIPEPNSDIIDPNILDVIYVPCICANGKNFRLGWGKGFYDRFFKKHNLKAKKIIVCPDCFITDEFVEDCFDFKCDSVISETLQ